MASTFNSDTLHGQTVKDIDGDKIGKVEAVYADDATNVPSWIAVSSGLFGSKHSLLPLSTATYDEDSNVRMSFQKEKLKSAPHFDADENLSRTDEEKLYDYYGVTGPAGVDGAVETSTVPATAAAGGDLIRSEERLQVGTETVETGRARLRKYVVTENVTTTIPVTHEEIRIEREPLAPGEDIGEPIGEGATEVILHAERPVVAKETVAVERVRLATDTVTDEAEINETLRKEQIDDGAADPSDGEGGDAR